MKVTCLKAAAHFYSEVLGWNVVSSFCSLCPDTATHRHFYTDDGSLSGHLISAKSVKLRKLRLWFPVPDILQTKDRVHELGGTVMYASVLSILAILL